MSKMNFNSYFAGMKSWTPSKAMGVIIFAAMGVGLTMGWSGFIFVGAFMCYTLAATLVFTSVNTVKMDSPDPKVQGAETPESERFFNQFVK